jgi:hypothetical protein
VVAGGVDPAADAPQVVRKTGQKSEHDYEPTDRANSG